MPSITRRDLISSGLALLPLPHWRVLRGREPLLSWPTRLSGSAAALPAVAPREQLLFDFGWKFTFGHATDPARDLGFGIGQGDFAKTGEFEFAKAKFDDSKWRTLNLPHDWAVELPFVHDDVKAGDDRLQSHGYKPLGRRYPETSVGWYRRAFDIPASDQGRRIWVEFDGAFRDVLVFVNGCFIGRNNNGYAPFRFDLTDFLAYGAKNYLVVRVDASFGDGWFYEGAGIYRHVWLTKTDALHLGRWESYGSRDRQRECRHALPRPQSCKTRATGRESQSELADSRCVRQDRRHSRCVGAVDRSRWFCNIRRDGEVGKSGAVVCRGAKSLLRHRHGRIRTASRAMPSA